MKKIKINSKKILIIIFIILCILLISLILVKSKIRTAEENFEYIYSDEMDENTFSPEMIHLVIAAYNGEENPKSITKSTYNLIVNLIPEYLKKCVNEEQTLKYYEKNAKDIYLLLGIDNKEEFNNIIKEISKLSGDLKFESAKFDRTTIEKSNNSLKVVLKIKYVDQEEISLNVEIKNKSYLTKPTIKFYK